MATHPTDKPPPNAPTPYIGSTPPPKIEENRGVGPQQFNQSANPSPPAQVKEPAKPNDAAQANDVKAQQALRAQVTQSEGIEKQARTTQETAQNKLRDSPSPKTAGDAQEATKAHQGSVDALHKAQNNLNSHKPTTPRR